MSVREASGGRTRRGQSKRHTAAVMAAVDGRAPCTPPGTEPAVDSAVLIRLAGKNPHQREFLPRRRMPTRRVSQLPGLSSRGTRYAGDHVRRVTMLVLRDLVVPVDFES